MRESYEAAKAWFQTFVLPVLATTFQYIMARLAEPGTLRSVTLGLISLSGLSLTSGAVEQVMLVAGAILAAYNALTPDKQASATALANAMLQQQVDAALARLKTAEAQLALKTAIAPVAVQVDADHVEELVRRKLDKLGINAQSGFPIGGLPRGA